MALYSAIITAGKVIIAGEQFFKMAASLLALFVVDVLEEEINAIPRNTKHATKFRMTLFKDKM